MIFLQLITQISKNSIRKRDAIACYIIVMMSTIFGLTIHLFKPFVDILPMIINSILTLISAINTGSISSALYVNQSVIITKIVYIFEVSTYKLLFILVITVMPSILMTILIRIRRVQLTFLISVFELILISHLFLEVRIVAILTLIMVLIISLFIPFGSGVYYKIIKYAFYIPSIYKKEDKKKQSAIRVILKFIFILIIGAIFAILLQQILPYLTFYISFLLYMAIVLLIWINQSKNKTITIFRKTITYVLVAVMVLLSNNSAKGDTMFSILTLVAIFFALERIIILMKELAKHIESQSLLFLIDEINDYGDLLNQRKDIPLEIADKVSEDELIRQIIINGKLGITSKATELIGIYRSQGFKKEEHIIRGIEYEILLFETDMSFEEKETLLTDIFSKKGEGIAYQILNCDYAYVLYILDKDHEKIVDLLKNSWLLINDEMKYVLYSALLKIGDKKVADTVRKEINNFDFAKEQIESIKKEVRKK